MTNKTYDAAVIGGGAAGLSGALALSRARRSVLVVDGGEPRNARAGHVHNYLGREGTSPVDLLAIGRAEIEGYGARVVQGDVVAVQRDDDEDGVFTLHLADDDTVRARRLLVTTGLVDELPDVAGLAERWGQDVLHCPYCHGWEVRDQPLGVLATGPLAVHQALLFRQWSADLTLFLHTMPDPGADELEQLAARGIAVVRGEVAALEVGADGLEGVRLVSGEVVPRRAIAVQSVFTARGELLERLGLEPEQLRMGEHVIGSFVPADAMGATSVPGVWVAGNVNDLRAQVISAAAAGLNAGAAVNADLIAEDTRRAVDVHRESRATVGSSHGPGQPT